MLRLVCCWIPPFVLLLRLSFLSPCPPEALEWVWRDRCSTSQGSGFLTPEVDSVKPNNKKCWKAIKQFTDSTGSLENLAWPTGENQRRLAAEKTAKVTTLKTTQLGQCHGTTATSRSWPPLPLYSTEKACPGSEGSLRSLQIPSPGRRAQCQSQRGRLTGHSARAEPCSWLRPKEREGAKLGN